MAYQAIIHIHLITADHIMKTSKNKWYAACHLVQAKEYALANDNARLAVALEDIIKDLIGKTGEGHERT